MEPPRWGKSDFLILVRWPLNNRGALVLPDRPLCVVFPTLVAPQCGPSVRPQWQRCHHCSVCRGVSSVSANPAGSKCYVIVSAELLVKAARETTTCSGVLSLAREFQWNECYSPGAEVMLQIQSLSGAFDLSNITDKTWCCLWSPKDMRTAQRANDATWRKAE